MVFQDILTRLFFLILPSHKKSRFSGLPEKVTMNLQNTSGTIVMLLKYDIIKSSFKSLSRVLKFSLYKFIHHLLNPFIDILSFVFLFFVLFCLFAVVNSVLISMSFTIFSH